MGLIRTVFKLLKEYPLTSAAALVLITLASLFEGVSLGMLMPLVQAMVSPSIEPLPLWISQSFIARLLHVESQAGYVSALFILLFLLIIAKSIFSYASNIFSAKLRFSVIRDLNTRLMDQLIDYDIAFFDTARSGHLITTFTTETVRVGSIVLASLRFLTILGRVLAYVAVLFFISFQASLAIFFLIACILLPVELIMIRIKKLGQTASEAYRSFTQKLSEIASGIRLIRSAGTEALERSRFRDAAQGVYANSYKSNRYIHLLIPVSEVAIFSLIIAGFLTLVYFYKIDISRAFPALATYLVVLVRALTDINQLNSFRSEALNNLGAFASYENLASVEGKRTIVSGSKTVEHLSRAIEFKDASFSYIKNVPVLSGITLAIPRGKITALVGSSGSGKSTIVNLILRFYDVVSGQVLVDGIDLRDLDLALWRRKIGLVSQDIFVFGTTVRENIVYGHARKSDQDVHDAARRAFAHDFIMKLPDQYDTVLGERGVTLSGGQKQRISIARAIIHDPEILILDEATSSLDTETERLIREATDQLAKGRTVIAIAHRLSTVSHADSIAVLQHGKIVEFGRHDELLALDGAYKRLYDAQFNTHDMHDVKGGAA